MKEKLTKFALLLNKKYGITPNILTYVRIFSAPWLALLILKVISNKSVTLGIITALFYIIIVATDFLDGLLARELSKENKHDHSLGGMLDRLSDKIFIVFTLIPFGINLYTILIIFAESMLAYQAITAPAHKKQAGNAGKIKMFLQAFLVPFILLNIVTSLIPDAFLYAYIILTIIFIYISLYSHFFDNE